MGKFDGVLLASDFDDTLYTKGGQVPRRSREALEYFISQGGRFAVATGRAHRTFAPYAHLTPMNAPAVLSNGSALYDFQAGRMLRQTFLGPEAAEDFQTICDAFPTVGFEAYHGEDIYVFRPNWVTDAHMVKVGTQYVRCSRIQDIPQPWTKAILQQDHDLNDIPMLERSAIPFAPSNCAQEVRDWGARVLCSCEEGVIGDIVEILEERY